MRVAVSGCLGRMGSLIAERVHGSGDLKLAAGFELPGHESIGRDLGTETGLGEIDVKVSPSGDMETVLPGLDVLIDFTAPPATESAVRSCVTTRTKMVIGTTGLSEEQENLVEAASREVAVVRSRNFARGVNVFWRLVGEAASRLDYDAEIVEAHHRHKRDAPSGTALRAAEEIRDVRGGDGELVHGRRGMVGERGDDEIGVHAVRAGDVAGDHTVLLAGDGERLEIKHQAHGREPFVAGALDAARLLADKEKGLYGMDDVLGL